MKQRVWISGGLLIVAVAAIFIYELALQPRAEKSKSASSLSFPGFNPDQVKRIEISRQAGRKDTLTRRDSGWAVENEGNFAADSEAAQKLLDTTKKLACNQEVSNTESEFDRFDLGPDKALEVKLIGDKDTLADFFVGKRGTAYNSSYYRKADDKKVCLVFENLTTTFDRANDSWKDKGIFDFTAADCKGLQVQDGTTSYTLEKNLKENKWEFVAGKEHKPAALWAVDGICQTLSKLKTSSFPEVSLEEAGLIQPSKSVAISLVGGKNLTLLVGAKIKDKTDYYAKRPDRDTIYQLGEWQVNSLFKKQHELVEQEEAPESKGLPNPTPPPQK